MVLNKQIFIFLAALCLLFFSTNSFSQSEQKFNIETVTKPEQLPFLLVKDLSGKIIGKVIFGEDDQDAFSYKSALEFKIYHPRQLPSPLIVAVAATPGGSNTLYIIKLITVTNNQVKVLNDNGWQTLNEGGLSLDQEPDVVVWNTVWGEDESRPDPHRYGIQFYSWDGNRFILSKSLETKAKYKNYKKALREFNLNIKDLIRTDFDEFNYYH